MDDDSQTKAVSFEFTYILDGIKYNYGFSATKTEIEEEHLYYAPNGQKALVFSRDHQKFVFRENSEKAKRALISKAVASNQLYFSVACTMNEEACTKAMRWFREYVFFSRDYEDIPRQLLEYSEDPNMLHAITDYAKTADIGIQDMTYEIKNTDLNDMSNLPGDLPEEMKQALSDFMKTLGDTSTGAESKLRLGEVSATSYHKGIGADGAEKMYPLQLSDESDGTRKLMALAPGIERVLKCGGIMLVDELEKELHPLLMEMIVAKFQSPATNKNQAQLIFTTHNTELLDMEFLRKDQLYFVDKNRRTGASELYSISEFSTHTSENVRKGYLLGKYGGTPDIEIEEVE